MEFRDLLCVDVDTLSPAQAEMVSRDIISTLTAGAVSGADQQRLKSIMVAAKRKALGDPEDPDIHEEVLRRIEEAEERGDKLAARWLKEGLIKSDTAAIDLETRGQALIDAANKQMADDIAAAEAQRQDEQQNRIDNRTHELFNYHHGDRTEDECREQATQEVKAWSADNDH